MQNHSKSPFVHAFLMRTLPRLDSLSCRCCLRNSLLAKEGRKMERNSVNDGLRPRIEKLRWGKKFFFLIFSCFAFASESQKSRFTGVRSTEMNGSQLKSPEKVSLLPSLSFPTRAKVPICFVPSPLPTLLRRRREKEKLHKK